MSVLDELQQSVTVLCVFGLCSSFEALWYVTRRSPLLFAMSLSAVSAFGSGDVCVHADSFLCILYCFSFVMEHRQRCDPLFAQWTLCTSLLPQFEFSDVTYILLVILWESIKDPLQLDLQNVGSIRPYENLSVDFTQSGCLSKLVGILAFGSMPMSTWN